ncbi:hypothetical protein DSL72_000514 [Monilinia vaccinii-corymbosi]|uniref:Profilin n=1 Tax=Monilinia vaccinii-corymbosi TaxID=61207 RepID=A0A8A3NZ67_9HELO|nr:hypothetical protein DSL72_000514 [Monilinia vaccinii-corymbosi]
MSWQAYIDQSLCGSGHVEKGAIYNLEGTSCWATSPGFAVSKPSTSSFASTILHLRLPVWVRMLADETSSTIMDTDHLLLITPEEMAEVVKGLNGNHDDLYANGLHIAGERYVLTKVEDENKVLYARKGKDGLVIGKTVQAIVVARYVDPMIAGNTAETVQKLVDYLVKVGY